MSHRFFPSFRQRFERGQAIVLFAAGLAGFCGLVGMAVDIGHVAYARTDLQKIADAAALAGAQDLPSSPSTASMAASSYATKNGLATTNVAVSSSTNANDTITVTATRRVDYTFLKVIGLSGANPSASATVKVKAVTGYTFDSSDVMPYAVWGGNASTRSCPNDVCVGDSKVYRNNPSFCSTKAADGDSSPPFGNANCNTGNYKGFFHAGGQIYQIDSNNWQTVSKGGNAIGQEPLDALHDHYVKGTPILVPVVKAANCTGGCSNISYKIVAWVAIKLTADPSTLPPSQPWKGTVVANWSSPKGDTSGNTPPPTSYATWTYGLTQ